MTSPHVHPTVFVSLALLARFHRLPVDDAQLQHQFGRGSEPVDQADVLRAATSIGLRAGIVRPAAGQLGTVPLPGIAFLTDGRVGLLAKVDGDRCLIHYPGQPRADILSLADFQATWTGELLLATTRVSLVGTLRRFDLTWFIPHVVKYRRLFGEILVLSFFVQLFALLTPLFTQVIIDKVLVHKGLTTLQVMAIGMLGLALFDVVLSGLRTYLFAHTTSRIDVGLGAHAFRHLLALPLAYFEARRVGDTVARIRELSTIRQFLTSSAITVVIDLVFTIVFLSVMWWYSWMLTCIVLAALPLYILLSLIVTPLFRQRLNTKFTAGADSQALLVEAITGIQTVKASTLEPVFQRRWEEQLAGYVQSSFRVVSLSTIASQTATFIQKATTIVILWVGAYAVMNEQLTIGQLIAFNMLAGLVTGPVLRLVNLWQDFQQASVSLERLGDVLNAPTEPMPAATATTLPALRGHIIFDQVVFRYRPTDPEVLRELSLTIQANTIVAIVGRSGSGKSTLTKLIQRLYLPDRGRILLDGLDLTQIDPTWLRRQIGVVLQDPFLFHRSIRDNIALADPTIPMPQIIQAATLAGAHDFIARLPQGYDTLVGERGTTLSGGQRQRLAIARALVHNPRILIFDEATSALDYESEAALTQHLDQICQGRTVILIAHRLTAIRRAHRIFVVDQGALKEAGTHTQLMAAGGLYADLHRYQDDPGGSHAG